MDRFDVLSVPLSGLNLIEASAGTGKTHAIANLFVRLLLERGLEVDQILVVTFTNAATEELRGRIRQRVRQALAWYQGQASDLDEGSLALLRRQADPDQAELMLAEALARMDESAVYTIHGFCQRVLDAHAFECAVPLDAELVQDQSALLQRAVQDFWRTTLVPLDARYLAVAQRQASSPDELLRLIQPMLAQSDARLLPSVSDADWAAAEQQLAQAFALWRDLWQTSSEEVMALLANHPAINKRSYTSAVRGRLPGQCQQLAEQDSCPVELPKDFARLVPWHDEKWLKSDESAPAHQLFDASQALLEQHCRWLTRLQAWVLGSAVRGVRQRLARFKLEQRVLYFDDLLERVDLGLHGAQGEALAEALRRRYPVALVDEFQDTDSQQYRIFQKLYLHQPELGLYLIGDPKQAIYSFRGADIHAYLQAVDDAAQLGHSFDLDTNWRSTSGLIHAVNQVFSNREDAFRLGGQVQFHPVLPSAKADDELLRIDGQPVDPLSILLLPPADKEVWNKGDANGIAAMACAERVAELLALSAQGRAMLGKEPLKAAHIAFLVRKHDEAQLVQQALAAHGINSVALSKSSVFASDEADELSILLAALLNPTHSSSVRAVLATRCLGYDAERIERLSQDQVRWLDLLERLAHYRRLWLSHGFARMAQQWLRDEPIAANLRLWPDGERRLTNLLHLFELAQQAEQTLAGADSLLHWLNQQRRDLAPNENQQLRLETDEQLVKVVTLHKSKGLQYPLVFMPMPWSRSQLRPPYASHEPGVPGRRYHLLKDACADEDDGQALANQEALAEDLRLFYVGLTRAAQHSVLCWGMVRDAAGTAPATLLHPQGMKDAASIAADLAQLTQAAAGSISVQLLTEREAQAPLMPTEVPQMAARRLQHSIDRRWRRLSFSSLTQHLDSERPDWDEQAVPEAVGAATDALPAGRQTGLFLHALFERLDFPQGSGDGLRGLIQQCAQHSGIDAGDALFEQVQTLVGQVLDCPLPDADGFHLRQLVATDRLNELEFHFRLGGDEVAAKLARALPRLAAWAMPALRGLMHGFIDLVFRHQGRYYLVDYKSNRLDDYGQQAMQAEIEHHAYDLQCLIYSLALHLHLKARLPGYDYEQHFGGAYYLFVRGMDAGGRGIWRMRPEAAVMAELEQIAGGGAE